MSKSSSSPAGIIDMLEDPARSAKKIRSAVTDTGREVVFDRGDEAGRVQPADHLLRAHRPQHRRPGAEQYAAAGYGDLKKDLAEVVGEFVTPIQERTRELPRRPGAPERRAPAGRGEGRARSRRRRCATSTSGSASSPRRCKVGPCLPIGALPSRSPALGHPAPGLLAVGDVTATMIPTHDPGARGERRGAARHRGPPRRGGGGLAGFGVHLARGHSARLAGGVRDPGRGISCASRASAVRRGSLDVPLSTLPPARDHRAPP